jgi:hypothetical protein
MAGGGESPLAQMLKTSAFFMLTISVFINKGVGYTLSHTMTDPFYLGAFGMFATYAMKMMTGIDYTFASMTFFIITKVIAQVTHGAHFENAWALPAVAHAAVEILTDDDELLDH